MQSGLYDGIRGRDRTVEFRIQSSSGKEQDGPSNQHAEKVESDVPRCLNMGIEEDLTTNAISFLRWRFCFFNYCLLYHLPQWDFLIMNNLIQNK